MKRKTYRRIEINAFRRRVTIVSGEWPRNSFEVQPTQTDEGVLLSDPNSSEAIEPGSPEGQLILVEALRSLEQRLTPEARAAISAEQDTPSLSRSNGFCGKLQSLYQLIWPKVLCSTRKEK